MMIFGLIVVGILIYLAVAVSRRGSGRIQSGGMDAMSILEERFARGEISAEDFDSMRKTLRR